jgi:hypothetical protein
MFQFPRLPSFAPMYSARDDTALPVPGFPIRASAGQSLFSSSPRLIAAVHALPRLLMPRHPPCALTILTVIVDSRRSSRHLAVGPCAGYNGDLERRSASQSLRCGASVVWPTVQFSRSGEGATGGTPRLVSQNSAVQARRTRREAAYGTSSRPGRRFGTPAGQAAKRTGSPVGELPRKEVIQPHLPVRLPCYDFTPITSPTFDGSLPRVGSPASGVARFRGVTGGVYKARERIHPGVADPGLLATPPSWRRVSASNPNRDRLFGIRSTSRYRSPLYRPM